MYVYVPTYCMTIISNMIKYTIINSPCMQNAYVGNNQRHRSNTKSYYNKCHKIF